MSVYQTYQEILRLKREVFYVATDGDAILIVGNTNKERLQQLNRLRAKPPEEMRKSFFDALKGFARKSPEEMRRAYAELLKSPSNGTPDRPQDDPQSHACVRFAMSARPA